MTSEAWQASLQHVYLLNDKIERLYRARRDSLEQVYESVRRELKNGSVKSWELLDLYFNDSLRSPFEYRVHAWGNSSLPDLNEMRADAEQFGQSLNQWTGPWPLPESPYPWVDPYQENDVAEKAMRDWVLFPLDNSVPKCDVVYVLYKDLEPIYAGSSGKFRTRLSAHHRGGKVFDSWQAFRSDSREAAYVLEDKFLQSFMPKLNVRRGR